MHKFNIGDVVRIISTQELKDRGLNADPRCSFAYYSGSICKITSVCGKKYTLQPITVQTNFTGDFAPIDNRMLWLEETLEFYTLQEYETISDDEFDKIME